MDDKEKIKEIREKIHQLEGELNALEMRTVGWYIARVTDDWSTNDIYALGNISAVEAQEWAEKHEDPGYFEVDIKEVSGEEFGKYLSLMYIRNIQDNIRHLWRLGISGVEIEACFKHLESIEEGNRNSLELPYENVYEGFD